MFAGTSAATSTPGLFNLLFTYDILAGTGRFAGASGQFAQMGTVDVRGGPPSRLSLNFSAVPEPASWALMLLGFGAVGGALRLSRRKAAKADVIPGQYLSPVSRKLQGQTRSLIPFL
jgi:hypothetical protein